MASISIVASSNNIVCTWETSGCSGVVYTALNLYKDSVFYTSFNTTGINHTFTDVPVGSNYYVIANIYTTGPTLCSSPTSNTVSVVSYCIPTGQTNIRFSDLATFYDLNLFDIKLSGTNNPSSGSNIFGRSTLPNTGNPSKTTPNAVSELRNTCGGVTDIYNTTGNSFVIYTGQTAENLTTGFLINSQPSNVLFYSPLFPGNPYVYCGNFIDTKSGSSAYQVNGIADIESSGSKTIRIAFSKNLSKTLTLDLALSGTIVVKRLSDNATLTSTNISLNSGVNPYTNSYTLSWSNSSNNTKIGITITVSQVCIV